MLGGFAGDFTAKLRLSSLLLATTTGILGAAYVVPGWRTGRLQSAPAAIGPSREIASDSSARRLAKIGAPLADWTSAKTYIATQEPVPARKRRSTQRHGVTIRSLPNLRVDATTVLCLIERGVPPGAVAVARSGSRPAGVALYSVAVLGVGIAEGDVLTEVLGQRVQSPTQAIAIVLAARASNRNAITGRLWRGQRSYSIVVEQPYTVPDCSASDAHCWRSRCQDGDRP
jgi:hypothetical protein